MFKKKRTLEMVENDFLDAYRKYEAQKSTTTLFIYQSAQVVHCADDNRGKQRLFEESAMEKNEKRRCTVG